MSWVYWDFVETDDEEAEVFFMDTEQNEHLDKKQIEIMTRGMSEDEKLITLKGQFIQRTSLVFSEFSDDLCTPHGVS